MDETSIPSVAERIEEAQREIGVLLVAFAPLDFALNNHAPESMSKLMAFVGIGVSLFAGALIQERRRNNAEVVPGLLIFLIFGVSLVITALERGLE